MRRVFVGGAPNPVSLSMILGRDVDRGEVLAAFLESFESYLDRIDSGRYDGIDRLYAASLYRRTGFHAYRDASGCFTAAIECVETDGRLVLRRNDGRLGTYMFKEVETII